MKNKSETLAKKTLKAIKELEEFAEWRAEKAAKIQDDKTWEQKIRSIKLKDYREQKTGIVEVKSIIDELEEHTKLWVERELLRS